MNDPKRIKLVERLRAMVAKAADPGATPEEAAAFQARVAELASEYQINEAEIAAAEYALGRRREIDRVKYMVTGKYAKARTIGDSQVADALGCASTYRPATTAEKRDAGLGSNSQGAYAVTVFACGDDQYLFSTMSTILALHVDEFCKRPLPGDTAQHGKTYRVSWIDGFYYQVAKKIARQRLDRMTEHEGAALVLVSDKERADAAQNAAFPKIRMERPAPRDIVALQAGRVAGNAIDLTGGLTKATQRVGISA